MILSRNSPYAAVFRRGPTRWTLLLRWNTATDEFEQGDWFKGRIYTRRCDVSPNGEYLVYFAANFGSGQHRFQYGYSWTAISRLPSMNPVALWAKDDCWFGGGMFSDDHSLVLNERSLVREVTLPDSMFDVRFDPTAHGEDEPIYSRRLDRDGWTIETEGRIVYLGGGFTTPQAEVRGKPGPNGQRLRVSRGIERFEVFDHYELIASDGTAVPLRDATWADWDVHGRLVFAANGRVCSAEMTSGGLSEKVLADLSAISHDGLESVGQPAVGGSALGG